MKKKLFYFYKNQNGGMLMELMISIALAAIIIPFVFRYQQTSILRARNVAVTKQMEHVQGALERYILENKNILMQPTGKNITRISIEDLIEYGLPDYIAENYAKDYQLRILKTADKNDKSILQGIVILSDSDITPLRTREIVNLGGGKLGFVEGNNTYGGFGAYHINAKDFGFQDNKGLVGTTSTTRGTSEYLWRVPSDSENDSTMLSDLNLDAHDIRNVKFLDAYKAQFDEKLKIGKTVLNSLIFANRSTIDAIFATETAVVNGALTADSRNLNVNGTLTLSDSAKFSSFYTNDLYVNNLTLSGFSVAYSSDKDSLLRIVGDMDLVLGHISAAYVSVGYTGSVTPYLSISGKIQDPKDSSFYWDVNAKKARFNDMNSPELVRMASQIARMESKSGTVATSVFNGVVTNSNATVGDYLNAINSIRDQVRTKYQLLNLE